MVGGKSLSRSGLLRKQSEIVIAMMGTLPGAGVTYSVISLGTYLAHHCHYRVALVENNESMHFSYIKRAAGVIGAGNYFSVGKMDFYERAYEEIIHKESTGIEMSFYLATLGQRYDIREYYREFGMRLYGTPCIYDPFLLVKEVIQFWRRFPI